MTESQFIAWHLAAAVLRQLHTEAWNLDNSGDRHSTDCYHLGQWYGLSLIQPYCTDHLVSYRYDTFQWPDWKKVTSPDEQQLVAVGRLPVGGGRLLGHDVGIVAPGMGYRGYRPEKYRLEKLDALGIPRRFTFNGKKYEVRRGTCMGMFELELTPETTNPIAREYAELLLHMPYTRHYLEDFEVTTGVV